MPDKFIVSCGGTGGHIYPAIAVAQEMSEFQAVFLGSTDRIDGDIVRRHGYPFYGVASSRSSIAALSVGIFRALGHIRRVKPRWVVCTGGMITLPVAIAAKLCRVPIIVLEQNSITGRTNRIISYMASFVIGAFPTTKGLPSAVPLGNPVRKVFLTDSWVEALVPILEIQRDVILVFGGSQGSHGLNKIVLDNVPQFAVRHWFLVHIVGDAEYRRMGYSGPIQSLVTPSGKIIGVILPYAESMDVLYRFASVVVCRSGATSLAELLEFQKPSVLIPYPYATDDHQRYNAELMVEKGASVMISESSLTIDGLMDAIDTAQRCRVPAGSGGARERIATMIQKIK
ncbi:UDP-N-acetylglucosamine--N-acetylmuramyl-(pentapeptide) pyrophosphoryl-undecaprenol N-acetylglucosamine transferase [bacterium]|nr:UDP-N-acetylglucosamine--N-acetylmuramyl-(pentapeptide) pyrophosphoryl-undecaprenol N-acetylglucosamine transferase [bacterium]